MIDARLVLSETNELARRSKADRFFFGRKSGMRIKKELEKKKRKKRLTDRFERGRDINFHALEDVYSRNFPPHLTRIRIGGSGCGRI